MHLHYYILYSLEFKYWCLNTCTGAYLILYPSQKAQETILHGLIFIQYEMKLTLVLRYHQTILTVL